MCHSISCVWPCRCLEPWQNCVSLISEFPVKIELPLPGFALWDNVLRGSPRGVSVPCPGQYWNSAHRHRGWVWVAQCFGPVWSGCASQCPLRHWCLPCDFQMLRQGLQHGCTHMWVPVRGVWHGSCSHADGMCHRFAHDLHWRRACCSQSGRRLPAQLCLAHNEGRGRPARVHQHMRLRCTAHCCVLLCIRARGGNRCNCGCASWCYPRCTWRYCRKRWCVRRSRRTFATNPRGRRTWGCRCPASG